MATESRPFRRLNENAYEHEAEASSGVGMVASEYCGHGAGRRTALWLHKGASTGTSSSTGASVELKMVRYVR